MATITKDEYEAVLKKMGRVEPGTIVEVNHPNDFKPIAKGRHKPGHMNNTEAEYASLLAARDRAGEIRWWRFEAIKLKLAGKTFLTPDFAVMLADGSFEFHEVKGGFAREDAMVKLKVAAEMYPFFRFILCKKDKSGWSLKEI